jgi:hypothetical protein
LGQGLQQVSVRVFKAHHLKFKNAEGCTRLHPVRMA